MKAVETDAVALQKHIGRTYLDIRIGIAVAGAALPWLLWLGDAVGEHRPLLGSMSAYYYTGMRDIFVGALVWVGVALYLYKGFSRPENWALNVAGVCAVLVAFFPMNATPAVHNAAAVTLFLCIAYVALFRASDTLSLVHDPKRAKRLRTAYRALGVAMIVLPLGALALSFVDGRGRSLIFFVEAGGVMAFAAYWFAKSREIADTDAEILALEGRIEAAATAAPATRGRLVRLAQ